MSTGLAHFDVSAVRDVNGHSPPMHRDDAERDAERRRKALREVMKRYGINAHAWAISAGLRNANAIYNFLRGRSRSLSQESLEALAKAAQLEVAELTGEKPANITPEERALLEKYRRLSDKHKTFVQTTIDHLLDTDSNDDDPLLALRTGRLSA